MWKARNFFQPSSFLFCQWLVKPVTNDFFAAEVFYSVSLEKRDGCIILTNFGSSLHVSRDLTSFLHPIVSLLKISVKCAVSSKYVTILDAFVFPVQHFPSPPRFPSAREPSLASYLPWQHLPAMTPNGISLRLQAFSRRPLLQSSNFIPFFRVLFKEHLSSYVPFWIPASSYRDVRGAILHHLPCYSRSPSNGFSVHNEPLACLFFRKISFT